MLFNAHDVCVHLLVLICTYAMRISTALCCKHMRSSCDYAHTVDDPKQRRHHNANDKDACHGIHAGVWWVRISFWAKT